MTESSSTPLTFDLDDDLWQIIEELKESRGYRSTSEVIRQALDKFDIDNFSPTNVGHRQISVRIGAVLKHRLQKAAKAKKVSIGHILRAAIAAQTEKNTENIVSFKEKTSTSEEQKVPVAKRKRIKTKVSKTEYNGVQLLNFSTESENFALRLDQVKAIYDGWDHVEPIFDEGFLGNGSDQIQKPPQKISSTGHRTRIATKSTDLADDEFLI